MKKTIRIMTMLFFSIGISGAIAQQATVSSGGNASGSGGSASYSVGQVVSGYSSGGATSSNAGVQQPYEFFAVGIDDNADIGLMMSVHPNPFVGQVQLTVAETSSDQLYFHVSDINGKVLISESILSEVTNVAMGDFAKGIYILNVFNSSKKIKSFSIVKNN